MLNKYEYKLFFIISCIFARPSFSNHRQWAAVGYQIEPAQQPPNAIWMASHGSFIDRILDYLSRIFPLPRHQMKVEKGEELYLTQPPLVKRIGFTATGFLRFTNSHLDTWGIMEKIWSTIRNKTYLYIRVSFRNYKKGYTEAECTLLWLSVRGKYTVCSLLWKYSSFFMNTVYFLVKQPILDTTRARVSFHEKSNLLSVFCSNFSEPADLKR